MFLALVFQLSFQASFAVPVIFLLVSSLESPVLDLQAFRNFVYSALLVAEAAAVVMEYLLSLPLYLGQTHACLLVVLHHLFHRHSLQNF